MPLASTQGALAVLTSLTEVGRFRFSGMLTGLLPLLEPGSLEQILS